ncbi:MAG: hypothetical protein AB7O97_13595 [Planctomycetota bacterium]
MQFLHVALCCLGLAATRAPAPTSWSPGLDAPIEAAIAVRGDDKPVKALEAWLKAYRAGKLDLGSRQDLGKGSIAEKFGLLPKGLIGAFTAQRELETLLEAAVALQNEAAAEVVLQVAAIGLDHGKIKYKREMAPFAVQRIGLEACLRFTAEPAIAYIRAAAAGEGKADKTYGDGERAAALRVLAQRKDERARDLNEAALHLPEVPLRLAGAESLTLLADPASGPALAGALAGERNAILVGAIVDGLRAVYADYLVRGRPEPAVSKGSDKEKDKDKGDRGAGEKGADKKDEDGAKDKAAGSGDEVAAPTPVKPAAPLAPTPEVQAAIDAVVAAIGHASWRADMHLVQFARDMDAVAATPALISLLQRFVDHPEQVESGELSRLLQYRAHATLATLTGAVYGPLAIDEWRKFWDQEGAKLLAAGRAVEPRGKIQETASGFFGIPVRGNRVLFVVDLSGSMEFRMQLLPGEIEESKSDEAPGETRLAFAKRQLFKVLDDVAEHSLLNIITFNGRHDATVWQKDLVEANKRNKKKAREYIAAWSAVYKKPNEHHGGTNMWSGLETALRMKTPVYGDVDEDAIDEMFVVSDGAPSVGEVVDPIEILRLVNEANRFARIRINTVFITSPNTRNPDNLSLTPEELMRRMAEENGGTYVELKR